MKRKSNLPWPPYQLVALPLTPATARDCHHEFLVKTWTGGDTIGALRLLDTSLELWIRGKCLGNFATMTEIMEQCAEVDRG